MNFHQLIGNTNANIYNKQNSEEIMSSVKVLSPSMYKRQIVHTCLTSWKSNGNVEQKKRLLDCLSGII